MKIEINATSRKTQGTGASRRLRIAGRVPGILYGGSEKPMAIDIDHNEIFHKLRAEAFHASILTMKLDGADLDVLLRDVQRHPFRQIVNHVDFQRIDANTKIHMKVPLHFTNADVAPGVKLAGGLVSHVLNEIDIICLPKDLPEFIQVDLSNLAAAHSLHVKELPLPAGVEIVAKVKMENPVVATIIIPRAAVAEEEAAAIAAADVPATAQVAKDKADDKAPAKAPAKKDEKKK
jgi:large subunit ribosomal protein L25